MAKKSSSRHRARPAGKRKKAAAARPKPSSARRAKKEHPRTKVKIDHWFRSIKKSAADALTGGAQVGACMLADPAGGADMCVQVDAATCTRLKGTFLGGPCF